MTEVIQSSSLLIQLFEFDLLCQIFIPLQLTPDSFDKLKVILLQYFTQPHAFENNYYLTFLLVAAPDSFCLTGCNTV